jgi:hypothetical protein
MAESRLHDFFLLVSQLLHTYGKGSSYVELPNWAGTPCDDCGVSVNEDDRYECHRCDKMLCGSCALTCHGCQDAYCCNCIHTCAACGEEYCSSCLATCPTCHKSFCEECLEAGLCQSCHEKQRNEEKYDDPTPSDAIENPTGDRGWTKTLVFFN